MSLPLRTSPQDAHRPNYRDELNFAEFPLASLSTVLPKDQKTLEFSDEIFDKSVNKRVQRKLTITASDKYGLPTATDDEVILGLIQLSAKTNFNDRKVYFTRYELLKLLGWSDSTRNYKRLEQSLNRWLGVTLYYEKSWWSKDEQSWVNEGFHILEHIQVLDQERQRRAVANDAPQAGKSSFVWNDVVFTSFKAGYIKQLDFPFVKSLESAISKRIYRFLDKRFYQRDFHTFDLRTFACEHIGLSKKCHNGELKRVLRPAIQELETRGFIQPLPDEARFVQESRGVWSVTFSRAGRSKREAKEDTKSPLSEALVQRGLSAASAKKLVAAYRTPAIEEKIALADWLALRKDARVSKSIPGFLYKAIVDEYPLPDDYVSATKAKVAPVRLTSPQIVQRPRQPEPVNDRAGIDEYWNALPKEDQDRIELELVTNAAPFLKQNYLQGQRERGVLFRTVRQAIIDEHVRRILSDPKAR
ncbi:hypothetical protein F183_A21270 [Bryobacterales bacterium F-183]|nr:hypothetical protein F183_A21270 [Bryobacterales bacterium F-183]